MIDFKKLIYPIIIIFLLFVIFTQRSCNSNNSTYQKVNTIIKYDTIYKPAEIKTKIITKYKTLKGDEILIPGKIDTIEVKVFEKATDNIQFNMFTNATKIRSYKNEFNNSDADVSIYTETKGELLKIVPTVHIKQVKKVETVFALYTGIEIYNNTTLTNSGIKIDLGIQNKRGDIYTAGYDTNNNVFIGYKLRLINIKK